MSELIIRCPSIEAVGDNCPGVVVEGENAFNDVKDFFKIDGIVICERSNSDVLLESTLPTNCQR